MTNRKLTATSRLKQDYLRFKRDPVPYIVAEPLPSNILEWHYVVKGPEDSPYHGGYYHGTLLFPREFPFKPPSIYMLTPNGRFKTNTRLCLSISDFHPDTWNPAWSVATILTGLLSFMLETTPTLGSTESTLYEKHMYARKSLAFNLKNTNFRELFPEIVDEINQRLLKQQQIQNGTYNNNINNNNNNNNSTNNKNNKNDGNLSNTSTVALNGNNGNGNLNGDLVDSTGKNNSNMSDINSNSLNNNNNNSDICNWQSICSNLIVVISFAIFALIVNYVIKNLNQE